MAGGDNNKKLTSSLLTMGIIIFKQRTKLVALLTQVSTVKEPGRKINKQASKQANKLHPKSKKPLICYKSTLPTLALV